MDKIKSRPTFFFFICHNREKKDYRNFCFMLTLMMIAFIALKKHLSLLFTDRSDGMLWFVMVVL